MRLDPQHHIKAGHEEEVPIILVLGGRGRKSPGSRWPVGLAQSVSSKISDPLRNTLDLWPLCVRVRVRARELGEMVQCFSVYT